MSQLYAYLMYDDAAAAIEWLSKTFGFATHFVAKDDAGEVMHAELRFGDDLVMLGPVKDGKKTYNLASPRRLPAQAQTMCAAIAGIHAHYARVQAAGANIITPLHETPYGATSYTCADPEGHIWTFGTYAGHEREAR